MDYSPPSLPSLSFPLYGQSSLHSMILSILFTFLLLVPSRGEIRHLFLFFCLLSLSCLHSPAIRSLDLRRVIHSLPLSLSLSSFLPPSIEGINSGLLLPSSYQSSLQSSLYLRDLLPSRFNSLAPQSIIRPASQAEMSPYSYQSSLMYGKTPAVPYPSVYSMPWLAPQPLTQDDLHFLMLMTSLPIQRPSPYPYYLPYQKKRRL